MAGAENIAVETGVVIAAVVVENTGAEIAAAIGVIEGAIAVENTVAANPEARSRESAETLL